MLRSLRGWVLVLSAVAFANPASAAKPRPRIEPADPSRVIAVGTPRMTSSGQACTVGAPGPVVFAVNYLLPPNDAYYTMLVCPACPPPVGITIQDVSIALRFPVPCAQPIEISVVGARGDSACGEPDTLVALAAPEAFVLNPGAPGDFEFVLRFATPVTFADTAFLKVNFTADGAACGTLATRPQLLTGGACTSCVSWNSSVAGMQELCAVQIPGSPVMYANVTSCVVPVLRRSWGAVKQHYR